MTIAALTLAAALGAAVTTVITMAPARENSPTPNGAAPATPTPGSSTASPAVPIPEPKRSTGVPAAPNAHRSLPADLVRRCGSGGVNPRTALVVDSLASVRSLSVTGRISVWINADHVPLYFPAADVDSSTGSIRAPGDLTFSAGDGYFLGPTLWVLPKQPPVDSGPFFPVLVKGAYSNGREHQTEARPDPFPGGTAPGRRFTTQYTWDAGTLRLVPGRTYELAIVLHLYTVDELVIRCRTVTAV